VAGITIAIDGPASSGKGTVARAVARALRYAYVDTGAMYRAVAWTADQRGVAWDDEAALTTLAQGLRFEFAWDVDLLRVWVDGVDITTALRLDRFGTGASLVSKLPGVRTALLGLQRDLGARGAVVMDGRDIGTVVLPDAQLKIYLDADVSERARRRHEELIERGELVHFDEVLAALQERDRQDMERSVAPLKPAADAVRLDSTELTPRQVVDRVLSAARERGA
jgi:cytidylate kinase